MQLINQEGGSYWVPAEKMDKDILNYKQWEIAFKVFMGVYIAKWPSRAQELLEYSHVIYTASLSYPWECVFNYDIAIREIMSDHPERLWGQICHHTWAIELGEPTSKAVVPMNEQTAGGVTPVSSAKP